MCLVHSLIFYKLEKNILNKYEQNEGWYQTKTKNLNKDSGENSIGKN